MKKLLLVLPLLLIASCANDGNNSALLDLSNENNNNNVIEFDSMTPFEDVYPLEIVREEEKTCDMVNVSYEKKALDEESALTLHYVMRNYANGEVANGKEKDVLINIGDSIMDRIPLEDDGFTGAHAYYVCGVYLDEEETTMIKASQLYNYDGSFDTVYIHRQYFIHNNSKGNINDFYGTYYNIYHDKLVIENGDLIGEYGDNLTFKRFGIDFDDQTLRCDSDEYIYNGEKLDVEVLYQNKAKISGRYRSELLLTNMNVLSEYTTRINTDWNYKTITIGNLDDLLYGTESAEPLAYFYSMFSPVCEWDLEA